MTPSKFAMVQVTGELRYDFPREAYDAIPRVNWSTLKHMGKSPAHYRHALLTKDEDTDARKRGRAVHLAVLEPERFRAECVVWDSGRRAGKEWERFKDRNTGKELLTADMHADACAIGQAARMSPLAAKYLANGRTEVTALWTHAVPDLGGIPGYAIDCKGRLDFVTDSAIVDLKTTRDASPEGFGREAHRYQYHVQAAYYADGYERVTGRRLPYIIVAVESFAPYVVQVYRVRDDLLTLGRDVYRTLLDQVHRCRTESKWLGYAEDEMDLMLPKWAAPSDDDGDVTGLDLVING